MKGVLRGTYECWSCYAGIIMSQSAQRQEKVWNWSWLCLCRLVINDEGTILLTSQHALVSPLFGSYLVVGVH